MAKPQNTAAAGRILRNRPRTPEEVLPGEPSAAARRGAQAGVMADIPGSAVDLSRAALGYGAAGLESLLPPDVAEGLGVSGFRRYMLPYSEEEKRQARAQFGAAPFGSSERIEEELVKSGALAPTTGTREEMVARLLAGLADAVPGPVGAGTLTGRRLGQAAAETATAPVFYSPLLEAAATSQTQKASPEQWISTLKKQPGIKEAELEWTGVEDWLKSQNRPVTRQELEDYLQGTEIQVQEVVKGGLDPDSTAYSNKVVEAIDKYVDQNKRRFDIDYDEDEHGFVLIDENGEFLRDYGGSVQSYDDRNEAMSELEYILDEEARRMPEDELFASVGFKEEEELLPGGSASYADQTYATGEAGGENYRELLLTIPKQSKFDASKVEIKRTRDSATQGYFQIFYDGEAISPVYGDSGGSGQYGFNTDEEIMEIARRNFEVGDKYNNVKGREFSSSHWDEPNIVAHVRFNDRTTSEGERVLFLEEIQSDWAQEGRKRGYNDGPRKGLPEGWTVRSGSPSGEGGFTVYSREGFPQFTAPTEQAAIDAVMKKLVDTRVPDMPFKSTEQWTSLALKRVIRYAADKGYDRIAWTPGNVQADRYNLRKHIKALHYAKRPDGTYDIKGIKQMGDRPRPLMEGVAEDKLADYVGDGVAKKIISGEGNEIKFTPYKSLSGLDLEVGGEGMKGFYDKIIPGVANKIGKKHGAKTEVTTVETAEGDLKALSIPMTEKLKSAAKQGLPYFVVLPPVMASSFRPEEQQRAVPPKAMPARRIVQQATQ